MKRTWQFNLAALFGVTTAATVPLAMIISDDRAVRFWGCVLVIPILGGCVGYLLGGWGGAWPGIAIAVLLGLAGSLLLAF